MTEERVILPPFEDEWAKKEAEGYIYGRDALENVAFGYEIARAAIESLSITEGEELAERATDEISQWERAYPLSAFPEPDLKRAAEVLKANGMTLDSISASNMRHVVSRLAPLIRELIAALSLPSTVRGEVIEECAKVAEERCEVSNSASTDEAAHQVLWTIPDAIRALKGKPTPEGE